MSDSSAPAWTIEVVLDGPGSSALLYSMVALSDHRGVFDDCVEFRCVGGRTASTFRRWLARRGVKVIYPGPFGGQRFDVPEALAFEFKMVWL